MKKILLMQAVGLFAGALSSCATIMWDITKVFRLTPVPKKSILKL